jgi:hypothetical protein
MEEFGGLGGLSATGILVVMVLKVVLDYIKSRDEANARAEKADGGDDCAREIEEQLKMLRETQARTAANCEKMSEVLGAKDAEGLPLVYTPRSLGKSIESLSQSISKLSDHVQAG